MTVKGKRMYLDLVASDYATRERKLKVISGSHCPAPKPVSQGCVAWKKHEAFTLRCFFSLQGEDRPVASPMRLSSPQPSGAETGQAIYRYDCAFGVTCMEDEKFWWDWRKELPELGALAIHLVLQPMPFLDGPEAVPVAATLSTLHPSRNTMSLWEAALPLVPQAAEAVKSGAAIFPLLNPLSTGLLLGSNVLSSYTKSRKNWFLYQFFDEKRKCPVVEWRISKQVLVEYGPLIRGTLFLTFQTAGQSSQGTVRMMLRPQIRYCHGDELCYLIPTNELTEEQQLFLEIQVTPAETATLNGPAPVDPARKNVVQVPHP
jgi:hypothetical protein